MALGYKRDEIGTKRMRELGWFLDKRSVLDMKGRCHLKRQRCGAISSQDIRAERWTVREMALVQLGWASGADDVSLHEYNYMGNDGDASLAEWICPLR